MPRHGDSSLLELEESWLDGDRHLMHSVVTLTSTPKRGGLVADKSCDDKSCNVSGTTMSTIDPTSITLGMETTDTFEDTYSRRLDEMESDLHEYDASQAREELSESIVSVRHIFLL